MSRTRRRLLRRYALGVFLPLSVCLCLAGCGNSGSGSSDDETYTIGFANPAGAVPILQVLQKSVVAYGEQQGMEVITLDDQLDANKQVTNINQFVAQHVDAIIVYPLSQDSLTPALNRAREAGIKIVGISAILDPDEKDIAPFDANLDQGGNYAGAQLNAMLLADRLNCQGNVLGIGPGAPVPALELLLENSKKYLTDLCPDINWLDTVPDATMDLAGGQAAMEAALTRYDGDIQGVITYNDDAAVGAVVAAKQGGQSLPIILGNDGDPPAIESVLNGDMTATVDITPWRQGLMAVTLAKRLLDGDPVPGWVANPVEQYTSDNMDERLDWDDAVDQIKEGTLDCDSGGCPEELFK